MYVALCSTYLVVGSPWSSKFLHVRFKFQVFPSGFISISQATEMMNAVIVVGFTLRDRLRALTDTLARCRLQAQTAITNQLTDNLEDLGKLKPDDFLKRWHRFVEFGEKQGQWVKVVRNLCGLVPASASFARHRNEVLANTGFKPCEADPDVWMRRSLRKSARRRFNSHKEQQKQQHLRGQSKSKHTSHGHSIKLGSFDFFSAPLVV